MDALFVQIQHILSSQSGVMAYHLVLSFCIVGGAYLSLSQEVSRISSKHRRLLLGLVALLLMRLTLFVIYALVWQGLVPLELHLPVVDRALTLLTLVLLLWLWLFPERSRFGDSATLVLVAVIISATTFDVLWRNAGHLTQGDYLLQSDMFAQLMALSLLGMGLILLAIRQPALWIQGLLMLFLLLLGHGLYLFVTPYYEDYPVMVRLFQLAAYPFLFALPARLSPGLSVVDKNLRSENLVEDSMPKGKRLNWENPQLWEAVNRLLLADEPASLCKAACHIMAQIAEADICLIVSMDSTAKQLRLDCGVDLVMNRVIEERSIELRAVPLIASSYRLGRTRRIQGNSTSPDLTNLAKEIHLERTGNVLFIPFLTSVAKTERGVLLLAPYSSRDWSIDEQSLLRAFTRLLVQFLHRSSEVFDLHGEIERLSQSMKEMQSHQERELHVAPQDLSQSIPLANEKDVEVPVPLVNAPISKEGERLGAMVEKETIPVAESPSASKVDGELILALEEIAYLRSALAEAETKLHRLRHSFAQAEGDQKREQEVLLTSIAGELRQNLAGMLGYTDLLLKETYGILGEKQKRSLERIRLSVERMQRVVEDLSHLHDQTRDQEMGSPEVVELVSFIRHVVDEFCAQHKEYAPIAMQLPQENVPILADKPTLTAVLCGLMENACLVSGSEGEVQLSLSLDRQELEEDFALIQIQDSGEGIPAENLAMVFSTRSIHYKLPGLGIDLSRLLDIKESVERMGGRIWVDNTPPRGATFSMLFPVAPLL